MKATRSLKSISIITSAGLICVVLCAPWAVPAKSGNTVPSLSQKANLLKEAILHERKDDALSILEGAQSTKEIHEMGDAISGGLFESAPYSVVLDGNKETIMFYHTVHTGTTISENQPVAGIVRSRSVSKQ